MDAKTFIFDQKTSKTGQKLLFLFF